MSRVKTNSKSSSHLNEKLWIRREALRTVKEANVLDCFHGKGEIWNKLQYYEKNITSVTGIERRNIESSFKVIRGDNMEILKTIPISCYNVFDLDAYGYPIKQMDVLFKRIQKRSVIIYTMCFTSLVILPKEINIGLEITGRCKTILGKYVDEMFSNYLFKHGITEYREYKFNNTPMVKKYGFFVYDPEKDLTRTNK